ncbi:hypothetical protein H310_08539 [Aphanomyces invadans]|uniref:Uncharacterized protein n=1 Tax=Aphanomyces invadans TaxID=157072 RepID=A0A024TY84_9STRA|nr:hypothetical protein H310_08539 [Aphanomyces invadans]ETV99130.1 hypothetical protein H310_08539 [Aphanomyces invadans]|eukprot:XP_008872558.1 hypothetical protein H310_08539 [Aphanomyces invadans]
MAHPYPTLRGGRAGNRHSPTIAQGATMSPNNAFLAVCGGVAKTGSSAKRRLLATWSNPFGLSSSRQKCHPAPPPLPACCEKRLHTTTASGDDHPKSLVVYKHVNRRHMRNQNAIVGGHRVPFFPAHNAHHRVARSKGNVLPRIDEDMGHSLCSVCHSHHLQETPAVVSITLY